MNHSIGATGIDVALPSRLNGAEVTSDKCSQDRMTTVGHHRTILRVGARL